MAEDSFGKLSFWGPSLSMAFYASCLWALCITSSKVWCVVVKNSFTFGWLMVLSYALVPRLLALLLTS